MCIDVKILEFTHELAPYFASINREWIEAMFTLEPTDADVIDDPYNTIIKPGGAIWFAHSRENGICGTCAIMRRRSNAYELTKMGVSPKARGKKVGENLLQYVIKESKNRHFRPLYLLTNKRCEAAIHLYSKNGFIHDKQILDTYGNHYERCNVAMRYSG